MQLPSEIEVSFLNPTAGPGTRVPLSVGRVLTARAALVACSACRNQASRAVSEVADQFAGSGEIGSATSPAAALVAYPEAIPGLKTLPGVITKIEVPSGRGLPIPGWLGTATLLISIAANKWTVMLPAEEVLPEVLRQVATALRTSQRSCCEEQVRKRLLPQGKQFTRKPHKHTKRRI